MAEIPNPVPCPMRRRTFLSGVAACAGAWILARAGARAADEPGTSGGPGAATAPPDGGPPRTRLRLVFSHHRTDAAGKQSEPGWPYLGYDCEKAKQEVLSKLEKGCPGIDFLPETAYDVADARRILEKDAEVDGYLAYMVGGWASAGMAIAEAGKPVVLAGDVYGTSGEILVSYAAAKRRGLRVAAVSSTRFEDVCEALRAFECLKRLRSSSILDIGADPGDGGKAIESAFGTKVVAIPFAEVNDLWQKADPTEAKGQADRWIRDAARVVEPTREEIERSAAMYLALRGLLDRHRADAVTMNCLGGVYSGQTHAYPCLGFYQLNSDGGVGACEADLESTISMLVMKHLAGRPGYISDPVIDTAGNRIVYIHCVAPDRPFGPKGPRNPYEIRSHAEDRKGAAVRAILPIGEMTTTLKFAPARKQVIVHRAKTVENIDDERSCRTKLAAELQGDMERLWSEWDQWGWHRVTFYGDHMRAVETLSALSGFAVVKEC